MTSSIENLPPSQPVLSSASKPLWAAVGILSVAVLAMGGTMIYQARPAASLAPVALAASPATAGPAATAAAASLADDLVETPVAAVKPAPAPVKKVVKPKPVPAPSYTGVSPAARPAYYPAAAPVCSVCGSVESVTAVQRSTKPAGVGIGGIAGGVAGAVLGNQIGHGNGRAIATVLGAVGGGFAGNAIEKHVRKETVYQVGVRMEDGSRRVVEMPQAPSVGSRVTVDGSSLRANEGYGYRAPAPVAQVVNYPQQPGYHGAYPQAVYQEQ